jgi:hypothetical protein
MDFGELKICQLVYERSRILLYRDTGLPSCVHYEEPMENPRGDRVFIRTKGGEGACEQAKPKRSLTRPNELQEIPRVIRLCGECEVERAFS